MKMGYELHQAKLTKATLAIVTAVSLVGAGFIFGSHVSNASTEQTKLTSSVAIDDLGPLANRAHALITCAELAKYADLPAAREIMAAGIEATVFYANNAVAHDLILGPSGIPEEHKVGFEFGRVHEMWTNSISRDIQGKQNLPYPFELGAVGTEKRVAWKDERARIAQEEFRSRNCSFLVSG